VCLILLVNAQGPSGRSLYFSSKQGTLLLHGFHKEALRRHQGLDSHRAQLPVHALRGRTLPKTSTEARISSSFSFDSLPSRSNSDSCMGRTLKPLSVGLPQLGQNAVVSENRRPQCRQCLLMCVLLNFPLLSATSLDVPHPTPAIQLLSCLDMLPLRRRIEDTSHCSITATWRTFTTTSHLCFAVCGSVPGQMVQVELMKPLPNFPAL
jgi:hypothetical protein